MALAACFLHVSPTALAAQQENENPPAVDERSVTGGSEQSSENIIVVEADRLKRREEVREFVEKVIRRPRVDKPVERFTAPVCPLVRGIKAEYGQVLVDRFKANAVSAGIKVSKSQSCYPNIYVLFVRDIEAGMQQIATGDDVLFEQLLDYQIDRVMKETGPVRAWNVSEIRDERGVPLPFDPNIGAYVNKTGAASRLRVPITMEAMAAIVIIDVSALPGKSLDQLADYATMRVLAPTNPVGEDGAAADTILSLFAATAPPPEMTQFDRIFLRTLYNRPANLEARDLYQIIAGEIVEGEEQSANSPPIAPASS